MKRSRGFTLIELMIVVAIIAILASLAITAYARSIGKSQLSEAFTLADGLKSDVATYYNQNGSCPIIGSASGVDLASSTTSYSGLYVTSTDVSNVGGSCVITAHMRSNTVSEQLRGTQVAFTMNSAGGSTQWVCSSDAPVLYLPQTCL